MGSAIILCIDLIIYLQLENGYQGTKASSYIFDGT
jgi:hypothetical protein